jgi:4-amino-4-deoxy-L-arabinose transferase-like glycosyltransferase
MKNAQRVVYYCLFVKLILAAVIPFFYDEAYYWFWGHNLQLSYFDHPPAVSWLFFLGHIFDGFGGASRWPGIFLSQATVLVWLHIIKDNVGPKKLFWFAILMSFWPMFGFASVVITPDIPLIFFWSLSILMLKRCLSEANAKNYLLFGLALGLGGSSKYQIALFIPCLLIYLSWDKRWKDINFKLLPLIIIAGLVACSPVFIWNYLNNWDSILFQIDHGLGAKSWKPIWTIDYIWSQALIIFPPVLYFALRKFKENKLLHSFAWLPVLFFLYSSTKGRVEANWPIMAYPAIGALAILNAEKFRWLKLSAAFWACLAIALFSNAFVYWLPIDINATKIKEFYRYKNFGVIARSYKPLYGSSFQMSSYLSYLSKTEVCKLRDYHRKDFFDYLDCSIPKEKRYYFLVGNDFKELPEWAKDHKKIQSIKIDQHYQIIEWEQP